LVEVASVTSYLSMSDNLINVANEDAVYRKLCEWLLTNIHKFNHTISWADMPFIQDNDVLCQLIRNSNSYASYCIEAHPSLDVAKFAIDTILYNDHTNSGGWLYTAFLSRDVERVNYVLQKREVIISMSDIRDAIDENNAEILQCLVDNGYGDRIIDLKRSICDKDWCCVGNDVAEILYSLGVPITPDDFKNTISWKADDFRDLFIWLYSKSPDVCDPETKAKAIKREWIAE
jgi:hypothetical protein